MLLSRKNPPIFIHAYNIPVSSIEITFFIFISRLFERTSEMNHNPQQQISQPSGACQPPNTAAGPYVVPPPAGYPMSKDEYSQNPAAVETKSRGDGFWKGCAAGLCCCCLLDTCF